MLNYNQKIVWDSIHCGRCHGKVKDYYRVGPTHLYKIHYKTPMGTTGKRWVWEAELDRLVRAKETANELY